MKRVSRSEMKGKRNIKTKTRTKKTRARKTGKTRKIRRISKPLKPQARETLPRDVRRPSTLRQPTSLQHLHDYVREVAGVNGVAVIESIGDGTTDDKIENKTEIKMSEIRSLLNQLHHYGLINYTREKNLTNGWFTYTWKFDLDRALQNVLTARKREYWNLKEKLGAEEKTMFYRCRLGCVRLPFDIASEHAFRCPKCKSKMKYEDNQKYLRELQEKIAAVEKVIEQTSFVMGPSLDSGESTGEDEEEGAREEAARILSELEEID